MSGRLDKCDKYNTALIKEGIKFHKTNSKFIKNAFPVWPAGTFTIDAESMFCTGLTDKAKTRMLLAVWNVNAWKKTTVFDLSKYSSETSTAKICYPANDTAAKCIFNGANGKLSVSLPNIKYSARLIEIIL